MDLYMLKVVVVFLVLGSSNTGSGFTNVQASTPKPLSYSKHENNPTTPNVPLEVNIDLSATAEKGRRKSVTISKSLKDDGGKSVSGDVSVTVDNSDGKSTNVEAKSKITAQSSNDAQKGWNGQTDPNLWKLLNHGFIRNFWGIIPKTDYREENAVNQVPNEPASERSDINHLTDKTGFHVDPIEDNQPQLNVNYNHENSNVQKPSDGIISAENMPPNMGYRSTNDESDVAFSNTDLDSREFINMRGNTNKNAFDLQPDITNRHQYPREITFGLPPRANDLGQYRRGMDLGLPPVAQNQAVEYPDGVRLLPGITYLGIDHTWRGYKPNNQGVDPNYIDPYYTNLQNYGRKTLKSHQLYNQVLLPGVAYVDNPEGLSKPYVQASENKRHNPDFESLKGQISVQASAEVDKQGIADAKSENVGSLKKGSLITATAQAGRGNNRLTKTIRKYVDQSGNGAVSVSSVASSVQRSSGDVDNRVWVEHSEYPSLSSSEQNTGSDPWYHYNNENYMADPYFKNSKRQDMLLDFLLPRPNPISRPNLPSWGDGYIRKGITFVDWPKEKTDLECIDKGNDVPSVYIKVNKLDIPLCLHLHVPRGRQYTLISHSNEKLNMRSERCESTANNQYYSREYVQAAYLPDHQLTLYPDIILDQLNFRKWLENEVCDLPFPNKEMKIRTTRAEGALHGLQFYIDADGSDCSYKGLVGSYANMEIEKFQLGMKENKTTATIVIKEDPRHTITAVLRESSSKLVDKCWETHDSRFLSFT